MQQLLIMVVYNSVATGARATVPEIAGLVTLQSANNAATTMLSWRSGHRHAIKRYKRLARTIENTSRARETVMRRLS